MCKYKKEDLEDLILVQKLPYLTIAKMYGCSNTNITKWAKYFEIPLPSRRKINPKETFGKGKSKGKQRICAKCNKEIVAYWKNAKYCSQLCSSEDTKLRTYRKYKENEESYCTSAYSPTWIKPILLEKQGGGCQICQMPPIWNDKKLVFVLDHIDGDASNNREVNLRVICPNCDSQLDTYKSKNKNSARKERYLKNYKN